MKRKIFTVIGAIFFAVSLFMSTVCGSPTAWIKRTLFVFAIIFFALGISESKENKEEKKDK